jgi:hypothetical protein
MIAMAANHLFIPDGDTCGVVNGFTMATGFTRLLAVRAGQWIFHSSQSDSSACVHASPRDGSFSDVHCPNYCGARSSILSARRRESCGNRDWDRDEFQPPTAGSSPLRRYSRRDSRCSMDRRCGNHVRRTLRPRQKWRLWLQNRTDSTKVCRQISISNVANGSSDDLHHLGLLNVSSGPGRNEYGLVCSAG